MHKRFFVTGIGTGVGKTVVSAIITEALKADYVKPIQCGNLDNTDSDFIREHLFNSKSVVHPESFALRLAASPHMAAANEKVTINLADLKLPQTSNHLIVEGAGGALVPLNSNRDYVIQLASLHKLEVILVVGYYLGSINHSLLTLHYLKSNNIPVKLIVFSGDKVEASKRAILAEAEAIPYIEIERLEISPDSIRETAERYAAELNKHLVLNHELAKH